MKTTCAFCRAPIDSAVELFTEVRDYPELGCEPSYFCSACVDTDDDDAIRGERIRELFIVLITAPDLDAPRILPGSA